MTDQIILAGFQRKYLRGLAHGMKPVVQVGKTGITEAVITAIESALYDHELIKVQLIRPEDKKNMANEIAKRSGSYLCGMIGHMIILYRPHPKKPQIMLPKRMNSKT